MKTKRIFLERGNNSRRRIAFCRARQRELWMVLDEIYLKLYFKLENVTF